MGFPAEVKRLRSDGENVLAQAEREKQALTQTLNAAQLEAQQALHKSISEHQEEVERLVSEKVRRFIGPVQALDIGLLTSSADGCSVFFGGFFAGGFTTQPADGAGVRPAQAEAGDGGSAPQSREAARGAAGRAEESPA